MFFGGVETRGAIPHRDHTALPMQENPKTPLGSTAKPQRLLRTPNSIQHGYDNLAPPGMTAIQQDPTTTTTTTMFGYQGQQKKQSSDTKIKCFIGLSVTLFLLTFILTIVNLGLLVAVYHTANDNSEKLASTLTIVSQLQNATDSPILLSPLPPV